MPLPPLLHLPSEADYQQHFNRQYVRNRITTRDGVRAHFSTSNFGYAFFESTQRNGVKDQFSQARAERMDWIAFTLREPSADWYQGWIARTRRYDATRSATVAYRDFVVVLHFRARRTGEVVANFVTCIDANNSIGKIRTSPQWDLMTCRAALAAR